MRKLSGIILTGAMCIGLAACSDWLTVKNLNNADKDRALARPTDVENLIAGSFNTLHRGMIGSGPWLASQMYVLGMENYSALANQSMGVRASIPRPPINNDRGNAVATENFNPYLNLERAARAAALGLSRVNAPGFTFFPGNPNQVARARAFAKFVIGASLGSLAMAYDSGSTINENDDLTSLSPLPFVGYDSLAKYALLCLDSARIIALASGPAGMGAQTVPATWLSAGGTNLSAAQFAGLVRGWAARIRAGVARNPTERAAVAWDTVNLDAAAFVAQFPADWIQLLTPSQGWDNSHIAQMYTSSSVNWHMMWGYMANFASDQASFDAWLATPASQRQPYLIVTPDQRWPQGASRTAQQCQSGSQSGLTCTVPGFPTTPTAFQYIENRLNDWSADPSAQSFYRHKRFLALNNASRIGNFPSMTTAEMQLLQAEAQYRLGNFAAAAALVDISRIAHGGLPGLVANGVTNNTALVPGGANCVPRIPVSPFNVSACGNLLEALKYEKRMETAYTTWSNWYFDGRGWGDLPAGTPPSWPVPYQEMDARSHPFYSMQGGSTPGTYGL